MSNPLALLPLALAAGGGRVDQFEAQQLVAAGLTLLQRSAPLVRALSGRRAALLLPTAPAFITALAASEGHGAVLIDPTATAAEIAFQCGDASVGAICTTSAFVARLPAELPFVLLDDAPRSARVVANGVAKEVDLGSHHGLSLEGERDVAGRDEEAAIVYTGSTRGSLLGAVLTHANLLANARATVEAFANTADDHVLALLPFAHLFGLTLTASAPLIAGARVTTMDPFHATTAASRLVTDVTQVVGVPATFHALLGAMAERRLDPRGGTLRLCVCVRDRAGDELTVELQDRWAEATGVELRQGYGLAEAAPMCLFNRVDRPNVRGTLGYRYPGVEVAIFAGEICVRGPNVFRGYLHGSESGRRVLDGWLRTGDRGVANADGTVTLATPAGAPPSAR